MYLDVDLIKYFAFELNHFLHERDKLFVTHVAIA